MPRCLVDGVERGTVDVLDRGLAYGDGVFETLRVARGEIPLWRWHVQRLAAGCARLGLASPEAAALRAEIERVRDGAADAVIKVIVTRGSGARGYAPPAAQSTRIVLGFDVPAMPAAAYRDGVAVRWCTLRLAAQPALAGIKHLNRLEQVLARAEWDDPAIAEGLLRDGAGHVIGATAANLWAVLDGRLVTPDVGTCGVAGVLRAWMLDQVDDSARAVRAILAAELEAASEVFLCNSVRGVIPVASLAGRALAPGPVARTWQRRCAVLGLAPEPAP